MSDKIIIKQTIVVEGRYDKAKLSSIIDANIIETGGFRIYKDKEKLKLLRSLANINGLIIITDSDVAGFKIRNYICGSMDKSNIINVYIPDIFGKEKRKEKPSAEGKLGVEGVSKEIILQAFNNAGVFSENSHTNENPITKLDFIEDGLSGGDNSSELRAKLLKEFNLPERMTTNAIIKTLNSMITKDEYKKVVEKIK
ncbi:MAG: DUF4093 domain-containing protein [Oscillospiraceae bacterium]